ncbi:MAG TPA: hypothetical protein VGJ84_07410 [Polyangiaceae bacterium]|jgi:hypothetical protein
MSSSARKRFTDAFSIFGLLPLTLTGLIACGGDEGNKTSTGGTGGAIGGASSGGATGIGGGIIGNGGTGATTGGTSGTTGGVGGTAVGTGGATGGTTSGKGGASSTTGGASSMTGGTSGTTGGTGGAAASCSGTETQCSARTADECQAWSGCSLQGPNCGGGCVYGTDVACYAAGCDWAPMPKFVSCVGSSTACLAVTEQAACTAANCAWTFPCTGVCSSIDTTSSTGGFQCTMAGCTYTGTARSCTGACEQLGTQTECAAASCTWYAAGLSCAGTAPACSTYTDSGACTAAGCTWG